MNKKDRIWISCMEYCQKYCKCHQMPERSFFLNGYQLPLCARCTGILIGNLFGLFLSPLLKFRLHNSLLMIPLIMDGSIQYFTTYKSNNIKRLITGILYGYSFVSTFFWLLRFIIKSFKNKFGV